MRRILEQMETPRVIHMMLEKGPTLSPEQRANRERFLKLSFYFGGLVVVSRDTDDGLEIVASGPAEEVGPVVELMSQSELDRCLISIPDEFEDVVWGYVTPRTASRKK